MIRLGEVLRSAVDQLKQHSESPRLDAEILLAHVLGQSRSYLYAHPEFFLSENQQNNFQKYINKRLIGIPIAYLTGSREFWTLPL